MGFSRPEYWGGQPFPSPGDLPNRGMEPRSPALQVDSLPAEPPWKPQNTGVGSLSLLQQISLTQELNCGLLHCRWILYQLNYQESPCWGRSEVKSLSSVQLSVTPWTVAYQAHQSMGFSRQKYWSGLPFPSPGDLQTQGSNPGLPHCRQTLLPSELGKKEVLIMPCKIP